MDSTTLLYFNSAIAQSMAALFAVVGVFFVFRIQSIDFKLRQSFDAAKEFLFFYKNYYVYGNSAKLWLDKDVTHHLNEAERIFRQNWPDGLNAIRDYKTQIHNQLEKRSEIQKEITLPLMLMAFIFLESIVVLPLSIFLIKCLSVANLYVAQVVVFVGTTIALTVLYILRTIKDPKELKINAP